MKWLLIVVLGYLLYHAVHKVDNLKKELVKCEHERNTGKYIIGPDADFGMSDDVVETPSLCRDKNAPCTMGVVNDPTPPTFCTGNDLCSFGDCRSGVDETWDDQKREPLYARIRNGEVKWYVYNPKTYMYEEDHSYVPPPKKEEEDGSLDMSFCTESVCDSKVCDSIIVSCDKTVPAPPPPPPAFDPRRDSCVLNRQQLKDALLIDPHLLQNLPSSVPKQICGGLSLDWVLKTKLWENKDWARNGHAGTHLQFEKELVVLLYNNAMGPYNLDKTPDSILKQALVHNIQCGITDDFPAFEKLTHDITNINEGRLDGYELCSNTYTPYVASMMPLHEYQRIYRDFNPSARFGQFNPTSPPPPPSPIFDPTRDSCVLSSEQLQDALLNDPDFFDIFSSNLSPHHLCGVSLLRLAERKQYVGLYSVFMMELSALLYNDKVGKYKLKDDPSSVLYQALTHPKACVNHEKTNEFTKIMTSINDGDTKGYNRCSDTYTPEIAARMPLWLYQMNYNHLNPSARSQSIKKPSTPYASNVPEPKSETEKLLEDREILDVLTNLQQGKYGELTLEEFLNSANQHLTRHKKEKEIPENPKKEEDENKISDGHFLGIPFVYLSIMWLLGLLLLPTRH